MEEKEVIMKERLRFLQVANEAYAALRNEPEAWEAELEEREEWDATLADGLEATEAMERR